MMIAGANASATAAAAANRRLSEGTSHVGNRNFNATTAPAAERVKDTEIPAETAVHFRRQHTPAIFGLQPREWMIGNRHFSSIPFWDSGMYAEPTPQARHVYASQMDIADIHIQHESKFFGIFAFIYSFSISAVYYAVEKDRQDPSLRSSINHFVTFCVIMAGILTLIIPAKGIYCAWSRKSALRNSILAKIDDSKKSVAEFIEDINRFHGELTIDAEGTGIITGGQLHFFTEGLSTTNEQNMCFLVTKRPDAQKKDHFIFSPYVGNTLFKKIYMDNKWIDERCGKQISETTVNSAADMQYTLCYLLTPQLYYSITAAVSPVSTSAP